MTALRRCLWCWAAPSLDEPSAAYESRGDPEDDFILRHPGLFVFWVMLFILTVFVCQMLGILPAGRGGFGGGGSSVGW